MIDAEYTLKLESNGVLSMNTGELRGFLELVSYESNKPINLTVTLADYPEVILINEQSFKGFAYYHIRTPVFQDSKNVYNYQTTRWSLNSALNIIVKGAKDTVFKMMIRYEGYN